MKINANALGDLLAALRARQYHFITPTPLTHARVIARKQRATDLRDVFGWSLPFTTDAIEPEILAILRASGALIAHGDTWSAAVRISSLDGLLFLHSAYPTTASDAVFFGPDSYRFASFLARELPRLGPRQHLVDVGAGSGVGAAIAAQVANTALTTLVDINSFALALARVNMMHNVVAQTGLTFTESNGLAGVDQPIDCVIANPPYIADPAHRLYRDGGAMHGGALSLRWASEAAERLTTGGALLLYTGSAIVGGEDRLRAALFETLSDFDVTYTEIDPDVFGEELERDDYADVERIAAVGVVAIKR